MWVFCSGMMRSGSTLQYQIAKTLVEGAGRGVGVGSCVPGRFRELLERYDDPGRIHVVKSHSYLPTAHRLLRSGEARSLYIYRDLRDVVVSLMHKETETFRQSADRFLDQLLEDDAIWSTQPNTLVSVYEQVTADLSTEVERIAGFLGIDVMESEIERIAEEHSLDRQKHRIHGFDFGEAGVAQGRTNMVDPDTLLHHNHVRSGASRQWSKELDPLEVAELERRAGDWLVERGYELSGPSGRPDAAGRGRRWMERRRAALKRWCTDARFRLRPWTTAAKVALVRPAQRVTATLTSVGFNVGIGNALYALTRRRPSSPSAGLGGVERVLVVRVDEIGDVVLTGPLLRELRRNLPEADITLVVKPGVRNLVERCPHVDRVITYDWSVSGLFGRLKRHRRALDLARRELWPWRLDLALLPRWARDRYHAGFLTYFSGAARRVAYSENVTDAKKSMNSEADRLFTQTLHTTTPGHEVERNLDMLRALGGDVRETGLEVWVDEHDEEFARRTLEGQGADHDGPLIALGIGAGLQRRAWPVPRYAEVARALHARYGARILAIGGPGEQVLGESLRLQTGPETLNLVGRTTLRQAAALLRHSDLYVGNDTGVMHLAAAAGVPVVEISSHPLTSSLEHDHSPFRFGPWGVENRVLQPDHPLPPCTDGCEGSVAHCITAISVERVLEAAAEFLDAAVSPRDRLAGRLD